MIKKSILTALAMLAAWHFVLPHLSHKFYLINGQQRANYQRAQQYIFGTNGEPNVLIGSSMSAELNDEILGPSWAKLTFPGGSLETGLEIVHRAHRRPPVVLIETNVLVRDADEDLLHDLFSPLLTGPRRHFPMFREEGRPSNFLAGLAVGSVRKCGKIASRFTGGEPDLPDATGQPRPLAPELYEQVVRINREAFDHPPEADSLAQRIDRLAAKVEHLSHEGCRCIFFEMPFDKSLQNLASPTAVRRAVHERFPNGKYDWLPLENDRAVQTRDGLHLTREEADRLTKTIVRQVREIATPHKPGDL